MKQFPRTPAEAGPGALPLVRDGDLIYGRGTDDDKGPLVAAMLAMRCVRELELPQTGFTAVFDSRDPLCATKENTVDVVERKFAGYGWSCEGSLRPAHAVDAGSDFIRTLLSAYETYSGKKGYCEAIGGGTYVHEIPGGVAFGAGDHGFDSHLHGANERARLSRLLMTAKIYALVISRLCA